MNLLDLARSSLSAGANERALTDTPPLTDAQRATLDRLALAWGMDAEDRAVMHRQCAEGGELAEGSRLTPEEARRFWFAEAGVIS